MEWAILHTLALMKPDWLKDSVTDNEKIALDVQINLHKWWWWLAANPFFGEMII